MASAHCAATVLLVAARSSSPGAAHAAFARQPFRGSQTRCNRSGNDPRYSHSKGGHAIDGLPILTQAQTVAATPSIPVETRSGVSHQSNARAALRRSLHGCWYVPGHRSSLVVCVGIAIRNYFQLRRLARKCPSTERRAGVRSHACGGMSAGCSAGAAAPDRPRSGPANGIRHTAAARVAAANHRRRSTSPRK